VNRWITFGRAALAVFVSGASACGETDPIAPAQLLLYVETDAPLAASATAPNDLTLFDRLRVAVHLRGEASPCAGCTRTFVLARDTDPASLSLGIAAQPEGAVAHVLLYAARNLDRVGEPDEGSALSAWITLPRLDDAEVRPVAVTLAMNALGAPVGTRDAPLSPGARRTSPLARWPLAVSTPCSAPPRAGEACVPGGVVWMGGAVRRPGAAAGLRPRLVRMSPFFVDTREVTVAQLRASGLARPATFGAIADPQLASERAGCTYMPTPGSDEDVPVTCVSQPLAAAYCAMYGKALPTEAQHEYLHGGLRGTAYPWGDDEPTRCTDVVFGRRRSSDLPCLDLPPSPQPAGKGTRDILVLGGAVVTDLAGNVSEWAREDFFPEDAECNRQGFHVDPACEGPGPDPTVKVMRGGELKSAPIGLRSEVRYPVPPIDTELEIRGFRCARAMP